MKQEHVKPKLHIQYAVKEMEHIWIAEYFFVFNFLN